MPKKNQTLNMQKLIIDYFLRNELGSSSDVFGYLETLGFSVANVTVKRALTSMVDGGDLVVEGRGPATKYHISTTGRLFADVDVTGYCLIEPDRRYGLTSYNFELFPNVPDSIMTDEEIKNLTLNTDTYWKRLKNQTESTRLKELERYVIELSWKSSKIEGNTYTVLDTERLIKEGIEAPNHPKDEAVMILNHKAAFHDILEHKDDFKNLTLHNLEHLHSILTKNLGIAPGARRGLIGVAGSRYLPLDNSYQISEAVESLSQAVSRLGTGYEKALLALLGISYIQAFEDGNKRTALMMANAILLAHDLSPLSYRSVDIPQFINAMLVFYELNTLVPFRQIFIEQYSFAAEHYAVS